MENDWLELSRYRLERAKEDLRTAAVNLENGFIRGSINRSYYAIFHAIRAILAMEFFDSKKHSGVIAYFQKNYVKTGVFDVQYSHIIETSFRMRNKSDYDDFYVINIDEAMEQIEKAKIFIIAVDNYLQAMYKNAENNQD